MTPTNVLKERQITTDGARTYRFVVFSNPVAGNEERYLDWYRGQHIHDLLRIEGFIAAQMFRLADAQYGSAPGPQRYMMVWEIRTDDLAAVFRQVNENIRNGSTVQSDAFDWDSVASMTVEPISRRVSSDEVAGRRVDEVRQLAGTAE